MAYIEPNIIALCRTYHCCDPCNIARVGLDYALRTSLAPKLLQNRLEHARKTPARSHLSIYQRRTRAANLDASICTQ